MHTLPFAKNPARQKHADCPLVELLPYTHAVHDTFPVEDLKVPAAQGKHVPPLGPVKPTLQVQAVRVELAIGELELVGHVTQVAAAVAPVAAEYVPAPQSVHVALPVSVLYVPATQAVHGPDSSGPVKPTLHCALARARSARSWSTRRSRRMYWLVCMVYI